MAFKITIPFFAFRLHFHSGGVLMMPLNDKNAIRLQQPLHLLAGKYAELLQNKVLNQGHYLHLLEEFHNGAFQKDKLMVNFPPAKDGLSYPGFSLEFEYFFSGQEKGYWGILPKLGLESFAPNQEKLQRRLVEEVKLEFARKKRFHAVQQIVASIWFDKIELDQHTMEFKTLSLKELDSTEEQKQERLLPQVAQLLQTSKQVIYGRNEELEQFLNILKGKFNRNILLVGPSGIGKTALVWEAARQLRKFKVKAKIWETTASTMIKELMRDTGWQDNLSYLCQELSGSEDILFVRNLVELFEVGKYEGNTISIADYLRSYVSRGEVVLISECTEEELARIELKSPNYLSFFQIIRLEEPGKDLESIILKKIKDIAKGRAVDISEEAIREVIRLNKRFTPYSGMPGKPIRFLESIIINKKNQFKEKSPKKAPIGRSEVIRHFCEDTGMPLFMVDPSIPMNVNKIKKNFNENVFGQENAVKNVVDLLANVKTGLTKAGKPIASFLFVGPTGVGKTELAKVLAGFMFGSRNKLVRFDMSEFSNPAAVMRLTGTGYFSDGMLTSAIRREPFSVLLFDEIEKAHSVFFDLLLQILSEGRLSDSQGKLVNFCSTIIIMTSNIGASRYMEGQIGERLQKRNKSKSIAQHFINAVQKHFRPELFNRIDQVIPFEPLDKFTLRFVIDREVKLFRQREGIQFRNMDLKITEEVLDYIAEKGYSNQYGARQLQRTIREELVTPLAHKLNLQDYDDQLVVNVKMANEQLDVQVLADPLGLDLLLEELDKINFADHASELRRQIYLLKEGHFYVRLLSELDLLELKRKKKSDAFWKNRLLAEKYSQLLDSKAQIERLQNQIEEYELELSLACLNQGIYRPSLIQQLENWSEAFFTQKVEIYSRLEPKSNYCHFAIYGTPTENLLNFYRELFHSKNFEYSIKTIWFRERFYNEEVTTTSTDENKEQKVTRKKRAAYIKAIYDKNAENPLCPPQAGDQLYGVEVQLSGTCPYLFLKDEAGIQRWKMAPEGDYYYVVKVEKDAFATPKNIHRQDFYRQITPRRTVQPSLLKDTLYKINREYNRQQLLPLILEHMEMQFRINLNAEIE